MKKQRSISKEWQQLKEYMAKMRPRIKYVVYRVGGVYIHMSQN